MILSNDYQPFIDDNFLVNTQGESSPVDSKSEFISLFRNNYLPTVRECLNSALELQNNLVQINNGKKYALCRGACVMCGILVTLCASKIFCCLAIPFKPCLWMALGTQRTSNCINETQENIEYNGCSCCCDKSIGLHLQEQRIKEKFRTFTHVLKTFDEHYKKDLDLRNPSSVKRRLRQMEKFNEDRYLNVFYSVCLTKFDAKSLVDEVAFNLKEELSLDFFRRSDLQAAGRAFYLPRLRLLTEETILMTNATLAVRAVVSEHFQGIFPKAICDSILLEYIIDSPSDYEEQDLKSRIEIVS